MTAEAPFRPPQGGAPSKLFTSLLLAVAIVLVAAGVGSPSRLPWLGVAFLLFAFLGLKRYFFDEPRAAITAAPDLAPKDAIDLEIKARTGFAQSLAALFLIGGLFFTWRSSDLAREGQVTERFVRAVDQLGSTRSDGSPNIETRAGGIYALERVAADSETDAWPIVETLSAYVRGNASLKGQPQDIAEDHRARADIQAAVAAIGRRKWREKESPHQIVDLSRCDLRGVDLTGAYLARASLQGSWLGRAVLAGINLDGADLSLASFDTADLRFASLQMRDPALLRATRFDHADLSDADLRGSTLLNTSFKKAKLHRTRFESAELTFMSDFTEADLFCAHLEGVDLRNATGLETATMLIGAFFDGQTSLPKEADPRTRSDFKEWQAFAHVKARCRGWEVLAPQKPPIAPPRR